MTLATGGGLVSTEVFGPLPEACRREALEGFAWYDRHDQWAMLALGAPAYFTASEAEHARTIAAYSYADLLAVLDGRVVDAAGLERARRGFSRDKARWQVLRLGQAQSDGMTPVTVRLMSFFSASDDSYPT